MEICTIKSLKTSSNLSEMVSKFAKACKLRSIGVFPLENPLQSCDSNSSKTTESDSLEKIKIPNKSDVLGAAEIAELFDIVSALKFAYVRLQEAHLPHNPKMIVEADKLVMSELESLYKLKRARKENRLAKPNPNPKLTRFHRKIRATERLIVELKSRANAKSSEAARLGNELREIKSRNEKLSDNVNDFRKAFDEASKSIHNFAKPLIGLMIASGWDLDLAAENSVRGNGEKEEKPFFSRRSDKKYAIEAYIARTMFGRISFFEPCDLDRLMRFDDPIDALMEDPGSEFAKFCGKKYLAVVHRSMEASFFGNLDHRELVSTGKHPRTQFYQTFAKMAMRVWVLQGIVWTLGPKPKAFTVKRGSLFSEVYMESVGNEKGESDSGIVEFMVTPGFKIGDTVVKSQVYISRIRESNGK